jgi:hypothetical protein
MNVAHAERRRSNSDIVVLYNSAAWDYQTSMNFGFIVLYAFLAASAVIIVAWVLRHYFSSEARRERRRRRNNSRIASTSKRPTVKFNVHTEKDRRK